MNGCLKRVNVMPVNVVTAQLMLAILLGMVR
jgi:hypothetical protein